MKFPLWQYLKQPLWDRDRPSILNPVKYWWHYRRSQLNRCWQNTFLEQCWDTNYKTFVTRYHDFCDRDPLEEDPRWLAERCWQSDINFRPYEHPENPISGPEYQ